MQFSHGGRFLQRSGFLLPIVTALLLSPALPAQDPPPPDPVPQTQKPAPKNDMPSRRERWFYEQRATPHGFIPGNVRLKALQRAEEMRKAEGKRAGEAQLAPDQRFAIAASTSQWTPIGPRPLDSGSTVGFASGRIRAIAVNPLNQEEVYIGGAQGGVWRSMNGGGLWTPLTDSQASLATGAIAIDGSSCSAAPGPSCQTIYVGTGEPGSGNSIYFGAGVLKTIDGGQTWTQLTGVPAGNPSGPPFFVGPFSTATGGARFDALVIQPGTSGNSAVLLAAVQVLVNADTGTSSGIYRSADGGATWTQVLSGAMGNEVIFDPANPNNAYAGLGSIFGTTADPQNGIYKSTNGGVNWSRLTLPAPVTSTNQGRTEIAIGPPMPPSPDGVLYASIANGANASTTLLAVLKSTDGGANWTHLSAGTATNHCGTPAQCWYDHVIRVHPNDPNVAYMGGSAANQLTGGYVVRTTDGGTTWAGVAIGPSGNRVHVDIQSMGFGFTGPQATRLFVGSDGGVWRADVSNPQAPGTNPLNWINLNQDLQITQFYPSPSFDPNSPDIGFGGTQDNGMLKFSGALLWTDVRACGDGGWTAVDSSGSNVYATCQNIDVQRSTNGGTSFGRIDNTASPIFQSDGSAFIPPLILDTNNPQRLYFATCRVWQTTNAIAAAPAWAAISPDLSSAASGPACPASSSDITAVALAPTDSNVLYVGTFDARIQRTTVAGSGAAGLNSWVNITGTGLAGALRAVTWIAVHPTDPNTVFVSFSGFSGNFPSGNDTAGHIFRATISGPSVNWVDISSTLPNIPVNAIVIDPANPNTVYLGTDVGVFFATDANTNNPGWTTLVTGLPRVAVLGMALHGPSRTLRAATHGRGMWDLIVPTNQNFAITGISPSTAVAGSPSFTLTVDGIGFSPTSVVRWNGLGRTPNLTQSAIQLTVNIPASDISAVAFPNGGVASVTVFDPAQPAPSLTNARSFTITPAPPPNDNFVNAIVASTNPFTNTVNNTNATNEAGDPFPSLTCVGGIAGSGRTKTVWYRFTTATAVTASVDTAGSNYDSVLSVWTGATLPALVEFACDDDGVAPGGASRLNNLVLPPNTYHFMIAGFSSTDSGTTVFNFSIPLADLSVTLSDAPDPANAGSNLTYTAVISNAGPTAASSVTLTHTVPANTAFISANSTVGACPQAGGTVTCTISTLNAGASATVTIVVMPGSAAVGSPLNATVTVGSAAPDPNGSNNSASTTTTVLQPPDISLSANPTTITVTRGQSGTSTITVTALGGFTGAVTLACSGLPSLSTCSFNPASVTTSGPSTMTITTTAGAMLVPPSPLGPQAPVTKFRFWPILLALLAFAALLASATRQNRKLRPAFGLIAIVLLAGLFVSCGGGGGGTPAPAPGTPRGTFTVTVTGTSGTISRNVLVTLTVN